MNTRMTKLALGGLTVLVGLAAVPASAGDYCYKPKRVYYEPRYEYCPPKYEYCPPKYEYCPPRYTSECYPRFKSHSYGYKHYR